MKRSIPARCRRRTPKLKHPGEADHSSSASGRRSRTRVVRAGAFDQYAVNEGMSSIRRVDHEPARGQDVEVSPADDADLAILAARIRTMLPEEYQDTYADVTPDPMRSAGLKFDGDG